VAYRINPPDPCYDQFWVAGCNAGDTSSACGGQCAVANACSPPEDPSKANDPMTFVCPRFMLFSDEMQAAARDDAAANGWGSASDPPFNYGVVGHDPDTGGLDGTATSTCCECYQLVFELPQYGAQDIPTPKSMIVQSFNTQAGGGRNFDVFMGAGGFGAFNGCVADSSFSGTTTFGHFLYTAYPSNDPETGGVCYLNYGECEDNGAQTLASVESESCQSALTQACDEAVGQSAVLTNETRQSCIQGNQPDSLYHQNWNVRAKKVQCPDSLTRVTGCRLTEAGLPAPDPTAQSAATADGTFISGYTTTTMQDCCKPSCAWQDYVSGSSGQLPADPQYNAFYSCDQNGTPFTAP
jgi:hypothetical protein